MIFLGLAVLRPSNSHPLRREGFVGAYASFACEAEDIASAVKQLRDEFVENSLIMVGVESIFEHGALSREPTLDEAELADKTARYPVQFKNIQFFKADS